MKKTGTSMRVYIARDHTCPEGTFKAGEVVSLDTAFAERVLPEGWCRKYEEPEKPAPVEEGKKSAPLAPAGRGKGDEQ